MNPIHKTAGSQATASLLSVMVVIIIDAACSRPPYRYSARSAIPPRDDGRQARAVNVLYGRTSLTASPSCVKIAERGGFPSSVSKLTPASYSNSSAS
jgi:hypothetical protein